MCFAMCFFTEHCNCIVFFCSELSAIEESLDHGKGHYGNVCVELKLSESAL